MLKYYTRDLNVDGVPLYWITVGGHETYGEARLTDSGKIVAEMVTDSGVVRLAESKAPPYWRPFNEARWPRPLPVPADEEALADQPADHGAKLVSWRDRPMTKADVEARIIRCIRTARVEEYDPQVGETLWPESLMVAILYTERRLRSMPGPPDKKRLANWREHDVTDYHVLSDGLEPIKERWRPTSRDLSDYETRPNPIAWIPPTWERVFGMLAALPPYNWISIGEITRTPEVELIESYDKALNIALRRAKRLHSERLQKTKRN